MSESTQETIDRVDKILARLALDRERQKAQGAIEATEALTEEAKRATQAAARSVRVSGILAKLDKERAEQRAAIAARPPIVWGDSMCNISCPKCGNNSDAGGYWTDKFGFDRPRGEMQCPKCGWTKEAMTKIKP